MQADAGVALVTQERSALRAAPTPTAPLHATLWQGEALEVRGERLDYLQVWDHRRERGGFVRASQVLLIDRLPPREILAAMRLARAMREAELLGIALAAAYLGVAPEAEVESVVEALDAIGTLAERLAERNAAGPMEAAERYGVRFRSVERDGRVRVCYDGEAFRRVLALPSTAAQRARAALALTKILCSPDEVGPVERMRLETWRAEVLDKVEAGALPPYLRNRILVQRASAWAAIAFYRARGLGEKGELAATAAQRAIAELGQVERRELRDADRDSHAQAARRVAASRFAARAPVDAQRKGPRLLAAPGAKPGETCVSVAEARPPAKRCTYGVVWPASQTQSRDGAALSIAVQLTEEHLETWTFRRAAKGWTVRISMARISST